MAPIVVSIAHDLIPGVLVGAGMGVIVYIHHRLQMMRVDLQVLEGNRQGRIAREKEAKELIRDMERKEFEDWKAENEKRQAAYDLNPRPQQRFQDGMRIWCDGPNVHFVQCPSGRRYKFSSMEDAETFVEGYQSTVEKIAGREITPHIPITGGLSDMTNGIANALRFPVKDADGLPDPQTVAKQGERKQLHISDHPNAPTVEFDEAMRQMMVRALAVNSLVDPGFEYCSREIAKLLMAEEMYHSFRNVMRDRFNPQYCRLDPVPPIEPHKVSARDGLLADQQPE